MYADRLAPLARTADRDALVTAFRGLYLHTWGARSRVLRHGGHWMLPDDHEIMDNLNTGCARARARVIYVRVCECVCVCVCACACVFRACECAYAHARVS